MAEAIVTIKVSPHEHRSIVEALNKQANIEHELGRRDGSLAASEIRGCREREAQLRFLLERL